MFEGTEVTVSKVTGVTKINVLKLSYEWKITNFVLSGHEKDQYLESATFGPIENDNIKWSLQLYPKGDSNQESKDHLSLFLRFHPNKNVDNIAVGFEFGVCNKLGEVQHKKSFKCHFNEETPIRGMKKFLKRTDTFLNDNLVPNGCLTLVCNIFGSAENIVTLPNYYTDLKIVESNTCSKVHCVYEALFKSEKLFDITFNVSGRKICAHKTVLAAHSPVFLAMFENDMREKDCGQVDITDVHFDVFQEMLRFIYSGKTERMSSFVNDLLHLADKYDIQALKVECEKNLSLRLCIENVIDTLIVADTYHSLNLKRNAIDFFMKHKDELVHNDVFNESIRTLPSELFAEITRALILH